MPISEFVMWIEYLDNELNTAGKMEYYLAQIAAEVRRSWVKEPKSVNLKDFLHPVKFLRSSKKKEISKREATAASKSFWGAILGRKKK